MTTDAQRWDSRYGDPKWERDLEADPFVLEVLDALGPGGGRRALDLACGTGRHALELGRRGWRVDAWDVSAVGLAILERKSREQGLEVATRAVDLAPPPAPEEAFDLVLVVNYLDRDLFAELATWLAPEGSAVVATFTTDCPDGPSPRHCLAPGELDGGLSGLVAQCAPERQGRAGLWARRASP